MKPIETISDIANAEATTARSTTLSGLGRFGVSVGAGVAAVMIAGAVDKGIRKLTGADKKDEAKRAENQKAADDRLRGIMNESADRTAAALAQILKAPGETTEQPSS